MIARLVLSPSIEEIRKEIQKNLRSHLTSGKPNHPDILYFTAGEKLGIAQARKIKEHFSLKPYSAKGRAVVLEDATLLTDEAQNALLKTLEELPKDALLILGAGSDANFLPTILSRCEIINLKTKNNDTLIKYQDDLSTLLNSSIEERFEYIEKLKNREEFLPSIVYFFRQMLYTQIAVQRANRPGLVGSEIKNFLRELLQTEQWAKQNVNIRAILEYLMLVMPSK